MQSLNLAHTNYFLLQARLNINNIRRCWATKIIEVTSIGLCESSQYTIMQETNVGSDVQHWRICERVLLARRGAMKAVSISGQKVFKKAFGHAMAVHRSTHLQSYS